MTARADDEGPGRRVGSRDVGVTGRVHVAPLVDRQAEEAQAGDRHRTDLGRPLANPAGEHQCVQPTEGGGHRRDLSAQPMQVHVERGPRVGIAGSGALEHMAHVGTAREPEQSRFALEGVRQLLLRQPGPLEQP
jgi:hypothetical protein